MPLPLSNAKWSGYNRLVMQVKDLGEFGVIDMLNAMITGQRAAADNAAAAGFGLLVDTGDDTAAWKTGKANELLTTDTVVEGVHFTRVTTPWGDLGWKSLASNISDIAAMGGLPLYAVVTLGLPPETEVEDIRELYRGILRIANEFGVAIVGGDMVRSPVVFITVGLTGVHPGQPMLRSAAKVEDLVAVTGPLGGSGGGLRLMLEHGRNSDLPPHVSAEAAQYLRQCHRCPRPAVDEGRMLSEFGVRCAMDVSDGLADDLSKLCRASGLSARIYSQDVPVHPLLKSAFPDTFLDLALHGGEDYLLLFTGPKELMSQVMLGLPHGAVLGELIAGPPGRVVVVDPYGVETTASSLGWDHFA